MSRSQAKWDRCINGLRAIPAANLLRLLPLGTSRQITPEQLLEPGAGQPIRKYLTEHPEIRCILTTSGVPYTVKAATGADEGAAFDNELAAVLREEPGMLSCASAESPVSSGKPIPFGITDPRLLNMVYVARLDGPGSGGSSRGWWKTPSRDGKRTATLRVRKLPAMHKESMA